jgi:hypothetical protein
MSKKILFITYHFPPYNCIGALRTGKTVKKLTDLGYSVRVVSASNQVLPKNLPMEIDIDKVFYTDWFDVNWPINKLLGAQGIASLKNKIGRKNNIKSKIIEWLKLLYSKFIHVPDQHIGWYFSAVKKSYSVIEDGFTPDIIFSSATPYTSHLVAKKVSGKYNIPWVAEFQDLWSDNHNRTSGFFDRLFEKNTMQSSNAMVTVSKPLTQLLVNNYKQPIYTIQNGYDEEDFKFELIKLNSPKIKIVYTRFIYRGKNDPSPLFLALSSNNPEEIIEFINSYQVGKYNNNLIIRKKYDRQLQINKLSEIIDRHAA